MGEGVLSEGKLNYERRKARQALYGEIRRAAEIREDREAMHIALMAGAFLLMGRAAMDAEKAVEMAAEVWLAAKTKANAMVPYDLKEDLDGDDD